MKKFAVSASLILSLALASFASAQTTCVSISPTLSYGSRSAQVSSLQNFLVSRGYPGSGNWMITGYFGAATQAAVKIFQQQQGLPQTGVVDSATASAINAASCGYATPTNPVNPVNPWYPTYPSNPTYPNYPSYPNYPYNPYGTTPTITSLSQNTGSAGNTVTIYGTGFDPVNNTVNFGSQPIYGIASSGNSITFMIPSYYAGASYSLIGTSVQLSVTNSRGTSNSVTFTLFGGYAYGCGTYPYSAYPYNTNCGCNDTYLYGYNSCQPSNPSTLSLSYLSPNAGAVGTSVTLYGSGFTPTGNSVHFGAGVIANLISPDGRSVSFTVPGNLTGYGSQPVTVGTYAISAVNGNGIASNSIQFNVTSTSAYNGAPSITNVTGPTSLQANVQGTWSVTVNNPAGIYATISVNWGDSGNGYVNMAAPQTISSSATQTMTFTHAYIASGTYTIVFTVGNQNGQSTTYSTTIVVSNSGATGTSISYLSPSTARVGAQIAIQGTGFSLYGNTVHFGVGGQQNVPSYNGSTIYYTIPSAVTPCDVQQNGAFCPQYLQQITPGVYQIYVTDQNGTTNTATLTVTY